MKRLIKPMRLYLSKEMVVFRNGVKKLIKLVYSNPLAAMSIEAGLFIAGNNIHLKGWRYLGAVAIIGSMMGLMLWMVLGDVLSGIVEEIENVEWKKVMGKGEE
jgi:hypothetical protein